tara:strand:- start:251 stop:508 length:258 start_codon:yes stop_codon:yes gene_type:complete
MCLFQFAVKEKTTAGAPPITPTVSQDTGLPTAQATKDADQVASIKFGGASKKDRGSAAAQKTGTDALKINLNQSESGIESGGINV